MPYHIVYYLVRITSSAIEGSVLMSYYARISIDNLNNALDYDLTLILTSMYPDPNPTFERANRNYQRERVCM